MLDHHLQRTIVYTLAQTPELRFSELKPDTIDSKLFTYHLKKTITAGYVTKNEDGLYSLTPEGRRLGTRVFQNEQAFIDQADSVLFLIVRRKTDGSWLLYKRNTYPLLGKVGFMHGAPNSVIDSPAAAAQICQQQTGLVGEFTVLGGGYFRVYEGTELESFTHFTLLVCEDATGELMQNDEHAEYFWQQDPDFAGADMLPNMPTLVALYNKGEPFFIEETLQAQ